MSDRYRIRDVVRDEKQLARFNRFMDPGGLVAGGRIKPRWMRDGTSFWYVQGAPFRTEILRVDGKTGKVAPLLDVRKTRQAIAAVVNHEPPYEGLPFDSVTELSDGISYRFEFLGVSYVIDTTSYTLRACDSGADAGLLWRAMGVDTNAKAPRTYRRPMWLTEARIVTEAPSPDGRWFASLSDGDIVLRASADDRTVPLTTDGGADFGWDIEAPRLKSIDGGEMQYHSIDPWSSDSSWIFAIKMDRRAVPDRPLVRYLKTEEELCPIKVQRAGGAMDIAHPHVIDVRAKRACRFELGNTENQYFTLVGWLPDASEVLFTRHSRDFKRVDLLAGNPVTGGARVVLTESAETFVALQHDVIFRGDNHVKILADGSGLIWRSSRSGWNHFYLYAKDGSLVRALTAGEFPVIDVVTVDDESGWVYFTAHHDQARPYDMHLCRVKLSGGSVERLTSLDGQNLIHMSPSKRAFVAVNSKPDRPFRTDFHSADGKQLTVVQRADVTELMKLEYIAPEEFTVLADDGETELWGVIHRPAGFDPAKRYPIIDHLYAGPQTTSVARHFALGEDSMARLDRALAQLGFVVISVDARGTPSRSKAFQDVVYRNFGRHEIPDHVAAIRQLAKKHSFIDLERVGVWGHSWGGYFALRALIQAPEFFRVGLASAPSTDPYEAIYYEPYLDLPTRAKAVYDHADLYASADKIVGKLMVVSGTSDPMFVNTMKMVHHLVRAGVDHELVLLPDARHAYLGRDDEYFVRKIVKHFVLNLK